ncbi:MAG: hypothetical protein ABS75_09950 [Pelagibacterium sp. SCN 63-23]|nr:MAG: hypothetical protein ABS75_09950 [Pelagibacterium sp. SCN 63-23]
MNRLIEDLDAACPGCVPTPADEPLVYLWVGGFVRHLIGERLAGRDAPVRAALAVIEKTILENGPDAELAVIGFLEALQNGNLHPEGSRPAEFRPYLGPATLREWEQLNGFWGAVEHHSGRKPPS